MLISCVHRVVGFEWDEASKAGTLRRIIREELKRTGTDMRSRSPTTIEGKVMANNKRTMPPIHPGETLREDFMKPLGLTANRLAINLRVPAARIGEIVHGRRAITADTALRLARYFGMSPQFWTNLQANYDLEVAQDAIGNQIADEIKPHRAA
jgi:antitoxin HigA-1